MRKNLLRKVFIAFLLVVTTYSYGQTESQIQKIKQGSNLTRLNEIQPELTKKLKNRKEQALIVAKQKGWSEFITRDNGAVDELVGITSDGSPLYYTLHNVDAARSTRTDHLNIGGSLGLNLDGQSLRAHVWDGGPTRTTHQEFDGPGGSNRVQIGDGVTAINGNSFHAQHVTGTIVAYGAQAAAKGMAPRAQATTYDWNNDIAEATTAAANGMLVSNHSYGFAWRNRFGQVQLPAWYGGAYIQDSRDWDELMYNAPYYLMVNSAGNDGSDNSANSSPLGGNSSFDKLTGTSTAKNNLVVANTEDVSVDANGNITSTVIRNSSSSEGPTDDYRIKPDIAGNGTTLYSADSDSNTDYTTLTGTSMSGPNVAGSLLLLQQHFNNLYGQFMRSATLKGVALHTADDAGISGPDSEFGWGLLNTKRAAETITARGGAAIIDERTLSNGGSYSIQVQSDGTSPLLASISWTDPVGSYVNTGTTNASTKVLVNDLDIRVTKNSTTYSPYRLTGVNSNGTGDNTVDPYERIDIGGASGTYTITVSHKGNLQSGSQAFTLIVTGVGGAPVADTQAPTTPSGLGATNIADTSFDLNWTASSDNIGVTGYNVFLNGASIGTTATNSASITGLSANTSYTMTVSAFDAAGNTSSVSSSINVTTTSGPACETGPIELVLITDRYGSETSWTLAVDGSQVASGSGYANNSTYTIPLDYGDGTYDFTINDSYGDGICCAYGNGSYTLTAGDGSTIATGGNFTNSASESFCVSGGGPAPDTQAPTVPAGLASTTVGETSFDVSWSASSDNVGVDGYQVFLNGSLQGTTTSTNYSFSGLSASTSYNVGVSAFDAAGNVSSQATTSVTTNDPPQTGSQILLSSTFDSNLSPWTDGGSDCFWYDPGSNYIGSPAAVLRDDSNSSTITSPTLGANTFDMITVDFSFHFYSMESGERLYVEFYDGSTWNSLGFLEQNGSSTVNGTTYNVSVDILDSDYNFSSSSRVRFRNDGSTNSDYSFIDDVVITGSTGMASSSLALRTTPSFAVNADQVLDVAKVLPTEVEVYPNPVEDILTLKYLPESDVQVNILSLSGQMIYKNATNDQINVSSLKAGIYLVEVTYDGEKQVVKFIKR